MSWWRAGPDAADERVRRSRRGRQFDNGKIGSKESGEQRAFNRTVQRDNRLGRIVEVRGVVDAALPQGVDRAGVGEREQADESKKECRRPHTPQRVTTDPHKGVSATAGDPLLKTHGLHLAVAGRLPTRDPRATSWEKRRRWPRKARLQNEHGAAREQKSSSLLPNYWCLLLLFA